MRQPSFHDSRHREAGTIKQLLTITFALVVTAACVGPMAPIRDAKDDQVGLVYGYLNGNLGVPNVTLYNKEARILAPWMAGNVPAHTYGSGLVVFDNVTPGEYYIHGFGVGQVAYSLGEQRIHVVVRPGEIKYLGAYQYAHEPGLFSNEFTLARTDDPSPAAVLEWAIEATGKTNWTGKLRARLRELNGAN